MDFTVKVTTPKLVEVPEAAEIVSFEPRLELRLTALPATGLLFASTRVTVMVDVVVPFEAMFVKLADTFESVGLTAPEVKVTAWVEVRVKLSVVFLAV